MATALEDLISRIEDPALRESIAEHVAELYSNKDYGLVFPRHLPEKVSLISFPIRKRTTVTLRDDSTDETWVVKSVKGKRAVVIDAAGAESEMALDDLVVVRGFGDPLYPGLVSVGKATNGGDKPFHTVINAENYHGLETLLYTHAGKVDLIYIDPPYNTGRRDFVYNDHFVDQTDRYRHSIWLDFMFHRLRLARDLLAPDGAIFVSIDDHELFNMGLLMNQVFGENAFVATCIW